MRPLALLLLLCAPAAAEPVVAGVVARPEALVPAGAAEAFAAGAREVVGDDQGLPPPDPAVADALRQIEAGEQAWLRIELPAADRALTAAVDLLLADPTAHPEGEAASRAALMLAQVRLARGEASRTDAVIERALLALPGFPHGAPPPPDLAARIDATRKRLASRLVASLRVTSRPEGQPVRVNGVPAGTTPVTVGGLPAAPVRVTLEAGRERPERAVALVPGETAVHFALGEAPEAELLRDAVQARDAEGAWALAGRLEAVASADSVCMAVAEEERVVVAVLGGARREVLGGHAGPPPANVAAWRSLGRFCAPGAATDLPPGEVEAALWASRASAEEGFRFGKKGWGWTAIGTGAAVAGLGAVFGVQAQAAADDFNKAGDPDDEGLARSRALAADVSYGVSAALIATGLYLLLSGDEL